MLSLSAAARGLNLGLQNRQKPRKSRVLDRVEGCFWDCADWSWLVVPPLTPRPRRQRPYEQTNRDMLELNAKSDQYFVIPTGPQPNSFQAAFVVVGGPRMFHAA